IAKAPAPGIGIEPSHAPSVRHHACASDAHSADETIAATVTVTTGDTDVRRPGAAARTYQADSAIGPPTRPSGTPNSSADGHEKPKALLLRAPMPRPPAVQSITWRPNQRRSANAGCTCRFSFDSGLHLDTAHQHEPAQDEPMRTVGRPRTPILHAAHDGHDLGRHVPVWRNPHIDAAHQDEEVDDGLAVDRGIAEVDLDTAHDGRQVGPAEVRR